MMLYDPFRGMGAWRNSTEINPATTSRCLNVVLRFLPLSREVGRNGETIYPEGPDHPVAPKHGDLDFKVEIKDISSSKRAFESCS